jgi:hypothetical protein
MSTTFRAKEGSRGGFSFSLPLIIGLVVAAFVVVFGLMWANSLHNDGVTRESKLSALYSDEQNVLNTLYQNAANGLGIFLQNSKSLQDIYKAVVGGQFSPQTSTSEDPNVQKPGVGVDRNQAYPIIIGTIRQAYPDMTPVKQSELANKILDQAISDQKAYQNKQSQRLDAAAVYNIWLNKGWPLGPRSFGMFPSSTLYVYVDGQQVTGQQALNILLRPITSQEVQDAVRTGTQKGAIPTPAP